MPSDHLHLERDLHLEREDGLYLSSDRSELDLDRITAWLASSYWASTRTRAEIERSIEHSLGYGVYTADGVQIALARAITDRASFAWIGDVFVDAAWRGKGIGSWLMSGVLAHLEQLGVPRVVLATRDAHEVYRRVGFAALAAPTRWMEIDRRSSAGPAA